MEHKLGDENRRLADYIYNDLSPEKLVEFEMELSRNPELSETYVLNKSVIDYLRAKIQLEEMRSDPQLEDAEKLADMVFENASDDLDQQPAIPIDRKRNKIRSLTFAAAIAAGVAILITLGVPSFMDQDLLFDRYYEPLEASDYSQRGVANAAYANLAMGISSYLDGSYKQSIEQFSQLESEPAFQAEVQFFSALSHLGLGQYENAQKLFESLISSDNRYHLETLWYMSLCCMKAGEFDDAYTYLGELEKYEGMYQKDSQSLRRKLRRLK
jgi:hypothetical protein